MCVYVVYFNNHITFRSYFNYRVRHVGIMRASQSCEIMLHFWSRLSASLAQIARGASSLWSLAFSAPRMMIRIIFHKFLPDLYVCNDAWMFGWWYVLLTSDVMTIRNHNSRRGMFSCELLATLIYTRESFNVNLIRTQRLYIHYRD